MHLESDFSIESIIKDIDGYFIICFQKIDLLHFAMNQTFQISKAIIVFEIFDEIISASRRITGYFCVFKRISPIDDIMQRTISADCIEAIRFLFRMG